MYVVYMRYFLSPDNPGTFQSESLDKVLVFWSGLNPPVLSLEDQDVVYGRIADPIPVPSGM